MIARIRLCILGCIFYWLFGTLAAVAADSASMDAYLGRIVGKIEVQGLKRIEKDAIITKLTAKPGQPLTRDQLREDVRAINQMGYFDEISVEGNSADPRTVDLTIQLRERPVIAKVDFVGNERLQDKDLKEVTKIKEWSILDVGKIKEDIEKIQKHYEEKGFYLAKVTFDIKQVKGKADEVELVYKINDYEKVQIKRVTFLNNKRFSDEQLKNVLMETREGSFFSFMSGSGNFKESAFKQDLQRLTYWYLDNGYVKFKYENPVVTVSDDKKWIYITIYVEEGEQYTIGTLDFSGDLLFTKDELHGELTLPEKEMFSISKRNADIQRLTEKYQDLGYAFTNVIPKMNIHDDSLTVDIDYNFEKGNLCYFGEITVLGNSKTHDKVLRREMKIVEGELFHGTRLRESKENIERLGFFQPGEVIFNQVTPKGRNDIVNIEIQIKERSTGTVTLGAGYSGVQGFFFQTQVAEINLLGRGQSVSLSAQLAAGPENRSFNLGFTEPYTLDTRWSSGFDLYYVAYTVPRRYSLRKLGADVRLGHPIFEYTNAYITYKNEGAKVLDTNPDLPREYWEPDQGVLSSVVWQVVRDKRNNRFETTDGSYQSASLETAGLGGDKKFAKWILNNRFYRRIWGDLVFRNNIETGHIYKLGNRALPSSEKFSLGGPNNLKGFDFSTVGPSIASSRGEQISIGGAFEAFSLFELEHPLIREAGLKWVVFYDVGNSWDRVPEFKDFRVRSDWGLGIRWFSPIGPLRFEWGFPFAAQPGEGTVFSFFIGPPF